MQLHRTLTKLPLQANFYPMPNSAIIQDKKTRLTLHSAQANGVASLKSGIFSILYKMNVIPNKECILIIHKFELNCIFRIKSDSSSAELARYLQQSLRDIRRI